MSFKDKIVLISGGTGGLGRSVTEGFLKAQARVVVTYTRTESFDELKSRLGSLAGELRGVQTNVMNHVSVRSMMDEVVKQYRRIDVLANLVGGYLGGISVEDTAEEDWDRMMDLNLKSVFYCCKNVLPVMIRQNYGRIINVGSKGGLQGNKGIAAYAASKAAVINLTQSLAAEGRPYHITANVVIPGTIDTASNRKAMPNADFTQWVTPKAIADVILFLSSEEAGDVSGAVVPVYGNA